MPKYRSLTAEELIHFEKEFIEYLVVNGIPAEDWEEMKRDNIDAANKIIGIFSDVVFEKVLRQTSYLKQHIGKRMFCFYFGKDKAELMIINYLGESDFENVTYEQMIKELGDTAGMFKINYQTKSLTKNREMEIFELIESGCQITDGEVFNGLKEYYVKQSN